MGFDWLVAWLDDCLFAFGLDKDMGMWIGEMRYPWSLEEAHVQQSKARDSVFSGVVCSFTREVRIQSKVLEYPFPEQLIVGPSSSKCLVPRAHKETIKPSMSLLLLSTTLPSVSLPP